VVRLALLISIVLSSLFLFIQLVQLDQVLFKTPFIESFTFLALWFLYFVSYFLPSSFFVSSSWLIFELKESKKLSVLASFGIDPKVLFFKLFWVSSPLLFSVLVVGYFIRQEDISYIRKLFVYKYYTEVIKTIPEKSFYTFDRITIRIEKREGELLKSVFLKIDDSSISAKQAQFKGDKLILKDGSLVVKQNDKYYLTKFKTYELTLSKLFVPEKKKREAYLLQVMNVVFAVLLAFLLFQIILRWIDKHTKLYYTLGLILLIHHITLILLKTMLS
jgi:lipopolysaccharide export LptBFGC system permease protein LptF